MVMVAGAALMAAPHVVGAPLPPAHGGVAPPELAALFSSRSLAVGAMVWAVLGGVAGMLWEREERPA